MPFQVSPNSFTIEASPIITNILEASKSLSTTSVRKWKKQARSKASGANILVGVEAAESKCKIVVEGETDLAQEFGKKRKAYKHGEDTKASSDGAVPVSERQINESLATLDGEGCKLR